ncbi:VCBS domain-containing protein [Halomonas sp. N3-2A]|uniref:VCBS domain-containing protein n=1 Tax=Halomonas sp. N3-2A TaxID=2014541 RepID=UPI00406C604D
MIDGEYGTLTINADGSYTYTLDNANLTVQSLTDGETLDEVFSYTLTDGDSDADDATLTITVNGSDDGVTVDVAVGLTITVGGGHGEAVHQVVEVLTRCRSQLIAVIESDSAVSGLAVAVKG